MTDAPAAGPGGALARAAERIVTYGLDGVEPHTRRRLMVVNAVAFMGSVTTVFYVLLYAFYDAGAYVVQMLALMVQAAIMATTPLMHRFGDYAAPLWFTLGWLGGILALSLVMGHEAGVHYYFLPGVAGPLLFFGLRRLPLVIGIVVTALALFMVVEIAEVPRAGFVHDDPDFIALLRLINMPGAYLLIFVIVLYAFLETRRAERLLEAEHARSERLLGNLLPESIAKRLKAEPERIIADDLGAVTILFADIVDFTPRAAALSAPDLVAFLNRVFTAFDRLAERHGLEKIKTIGDAYMVAAGMPDPRRDHAEAVAEMALDMLAATEALSAEGDEQVAVRIGLHTGQAVAGVIGTRKFFYDVWGDTVNTAARMEAQGAPGRIQVTPDARAALEDAFTLEPRGEIEVKGKGRMETYWLTGRREE